MPILKATYEGEAYPHMLKPVDYDSFSPKPATAAARPKNLLQMQLLGSWIESEI